MSREATSARGAVQSKTSFTAKLTSWRLHHAQSARESLLRIVVSPLSSLMTCLVVAIALALPTTLFVALGNLQVLGDSWDANPKISVYVNTRARDAAIQHLQQTIVAYPEVKSIDYISPDQALQEFGRMSGFGDVISSLEENPLPPTLVVAPKAGQSDSVTLKRVASRIAEQSIVESVDLDMDWVRRLQEMMALGRKIVAALAGLLGVGVLLSLGNTIRLAIENRKEEIIITKLVGGSDGFVRRPFLYSGAWYGFLGGVLACALITVGLSSISGTVENLALAYQSNFQLKGLEAKSIVLLLLVSASLGLAGSWLAVSRHLHEIQPR